MLHRLQVTIDLHKSKLYVKTKQKFSKDFNSFARFKSRQTLNSRSKCWVKTLLKKQKSKYTNSEGSNVAVSGLWFTVSGKIWKIEPIPEQTLKIVFTGGAPRSLYFSYLWFDSIILEVALRQDNRKCKFFFVCLADSISLFKQLIRKKVSHLTCILIEGTFLSTNQHPCIFSCFKRPSTHMQDALENVFVQREIIFTHRLALEESNSCLSRPTVLYV